MDNVLYKILYSNILYYNFKAITGIDKTLSMFQAYYGGRVHDLQIVVSGPGPTVVGGTTGTRSLTLLRVFFFFFIIIICQTILIYGAYCL